MISECMGKNTASYAFSGYEFSSDFKWKKILKLLELRTRKPPPKTYAVVSHAVARRNVQVLLSANFGSE